ncbi:MAG: MotA/TolQ/ExbB proton channel family protein [Acidithiobacillus ferrivorans]|uniref:MotA/TolQ/ExbB proton channel n=1 Tax=Acidithiobacillus ferrivorans SS3 TaxID=743299 RepID=G0JKU8_9PROT|nr:MotA/TolQ/ExbB proton channel family protein [Acidithiobacillus ferrivorans]AEM46844.1 MotA/TolQ/ExbB proton channel [Acidithiobacillus ferrivorans SS3]MBU2765200.1 MotA/TolQ/ExbB proton channel family protein [Acidithiobacillus ferrivorans]
MISFSYLVHLANYSDGVLYILMLLFVVELAVIFDRSWYLRNAISKGKKILWGISVRGKLRRPDLEELVALSKGLPEEALLGVALRHFNLIHHYGSARGEAFANRLDEAIFLTTPSLDKRLWILDTIVTLAPLLGLFGTILGMFHAFSILAVPGHNPTSVTGGVADALIATASGLFIAMIGLLSFNAFNNAIEKTIYQLESLKVVLMNRLDGAPVVLEDTAAVKAPSSATASEMTA